MDHQTKLASAIWIIVMVSAFLILTGCSGLSVSGGCCSLNNISVQKTWVLPTPTTYEEEKNVQDKYPIIPVIVENLAK
jgi:hypothetical protein|tara:strand:- start:2633 stop:2866 length:234 start_codon:yes stop_codon:yes gene_type:complete